MSNVAPQTPTSSDSVSRGALAQWFVLAVVGLSALSLVAAHLPARFKLIGLFLPAYGVVAGLGLRGALWAVGCPPTRGLIALVPILIAAGLVGLALESHRLYARDVAANQTSDPAVLAAARLLHQGAAPDDPEDRQRHAKFVESYQKAIEEQQRERERAMSFAGYLKYRLASLGDWEHPWPEVFWGGEVLLSSLAGTWLAGVGAKRGPQPDNLGAALRSDPSGPNTA